MDNLDEVLSIMSDFLVVFVRPQTEDYQNLIRDLARRVGDLINQFGAALVFGIFKYADVATLPAVRDNHKAWLNTIMSVERFQYNKRLVAAGNSIRHKRFCSYFFSVAYPYLQLQIEDTEKEPPMALVDDVEAERINASKVRQEPRPPPKQTETTLKSPDLSDIVEYSESSATLSPSNSSFERAYMDIEDRRGKRRFKYQEKQVLEVLAKFKKQEKAFRYDLGTSDQGFL